MRVWTTFLLTIATTAHGLADLPKPASKPSSKTKTPATSHTPQFYLSQPLEISPSGCVAKTDLETKYKGSSIDTGNFATAQVVVPAEYVKEGYEKTWEVLKKAMQDLGFSYYDVKSGWNANVPGAAVRDSYALAHFAVDENAFVCLDPKKVKPLLDEIQFFNSRTNGRTPTHVRQLVLSFEKLGDLSTEWSDGYCRVSLVFHPVILFDSDSEFAFGEAPHDAGKLLYDLVDALRERFEMDGLAFHFKWIPGAPLPDDAALKISPTTSTSDPKPGTWNVSYVEWDPLSRTPYAWTGRMSLSGSGDHIRATIDWKSSKRKAHGREYCSARFDPTTRTLILKGTRLSGDSVGIGQGTYTANVSNAGQHLIRGNWNTATPDFWSAAWVADPTGNQ